MKPVRYVRADVAALHAIDEWIASDEGYEVASPVRLARSRDEGSSARSKATSKSSGKKSGPGKSGSKKAGKYDESLPPSRPAKRAKKRPGPVTKLFDYHVIAGELKGRAIEAPDLGVTRPPLTRVRRAIFDFLDPYIVGKRYLDLYSGTGSYLFEAVSRGASYCLGVELERKLTGALESESVRLGVSRRLQLLNADVLKVLPTLHERYQPFDVVMIAPPQYKNLIISTLALLPDAILTNDAMVLCQFDPSEKFVADTERWELIQERKYGNTIFAVVRVKDK